VELGVHIVEGYTASSETARLIVGSQYLLHEDFNIGVTTYAIENTTNRPLTVTVEAPIQPSWELFETPPPTDETLTDRRWQVSVAAHGRATFTRRERLLTSRSEAIINLDYRVLMSYFEDRWLDHAAFERLKGILERRDWVRKAQQEQGKLESERTKLYQQQEQLRANLGSLRETGKEADLRDRMLAQLAGSQDRLDAIDARLAELAHLISAAEAELQEMLKDLK
jgi:hypothetical protein